MAVSGYFNQEQAALFLPVFDRVVRSALNSKHDLWKAFEKETDKQKFVGGKYIMTFKTARNTGIRGVSVGGNMPVAGLPKAAQAQIDISTVYGSLRVDKPSVDRASSSVGALAEFLKFLTEDMVDGLQLRNGRMLLGAAKQESAAKTNFNGVSAIVNGTQSAVTSLLVHGANAWHLGDGTTFIARGSDSLLVGDAIVIGTATALKNGTGVKTTVTDIPLSGAGGTLTVSPAVTVTDGDLIVRGDDLKSASHEYNTVPSGLGFLEMVNVGGDDTFQGQVMSSAGLDLVYKPNRQSNSTTAGTVAPFNIGRIRGIVMQHVEDFGAASIENLRFFSHWSVQEAYTQQLTSQVRYVKHDPQEGLQDAPVQAFAMGKKIPWMTDRMCPRDKIFALDMSSMCIAELKPGKFLNWNGGGSMWLDAIEQAQLIGRWEWEGAFGVRKPGANLLIDDVDTSSINP